LVTLYAVEIEDEMKCEEYHQNILLRAYGYKCFVFEAACQNVSYIAPLVDTMVQVGAEYT
jgi:hypothetical protein